MKFNAVKRETVCDKIILQIKRKIKNGDLKPGEKLPPERELAEMFDVGRSSVREAVLVLDSIGLVKKTIDGSYVNRDPYVIHRPIVEDEKYYVELYEARELTELSIIGLAAQNRNDENIELLDEILKEMSNVKDDIKSFARLDADFHTNIAYASKNKFLAEYISEIGGILRKQVIEYLTRCKNDNTINEKEETEMTMKEHENILEAIKNRDVITAKVEMHKHLESGKSMFRN
jgi:GntR family transcriptional repressor for pyruvate dehydrogenase complex